MAASTDSGLRCLIACGRCGRQFDATGFAAKSRVHCSCGELIEVPRFAPRDAAVVRCSSCSAPRGKGASACAHCGADYTLHEQDLQTVCPACMTRLPERARFCHHCATPIAVQGSLGTPTKRPCPACGRRDKLSSRPLGEPAVTVLECGRCAGIWLAAEVFELLTERARDVAAPSPDIRVGAVEATDSGGSAGPLYRRCPHCDQLMNRKNFGQGSGVIVDSCKEHGIWFDCAELDSVLRWIRDGGEKRIAAKRADERRANERKQRMNVPRESQAGVPQVPYTRSYSILDDFESIADVLTSLFGR